MQRPFFNAILYTYCFPNGRTVPVMRRDLGNDLPLPLPLSGTPISRGRNGRDPLWRIEADPTKWMRFSSNAKRTGRGTARRG
eukprot:scaffold695_cov384-Prasinococcus_capsulatus_cf.AAC.9